MVTEITPEQLAARLAAGDRPVVLDVREEWERELASLPQTVHIPMNEIPARLSELDPQSEIVVMCHAGGRSLQVARFLDSRGFSRVANLTGGIHRWSVAVDGNVPTY